MNKTLEDKLGKLGMLLIFGYLSWIQIMAMVATVVHRDAIALWQLALVSKVAGLIFLGLIVYYTATRLPPRSSASGLAPRLIALAGTFIMMLVALLPAPEIGASLRVVSTALIIIGTCLSIFCIRQLGRSFSIMASARALVTDGPYRLVRHPLYGAELVTVIGMVLSVWSPAAVVLGLIALALQIRRAQNEERVLRDSFPEYASYARRVPMLLPGFALPRLGRA